MVNAIAVVAHSRADLLKECIQSILNADKQQLFKKVLVIQSGHTDVAKVVQHYEHVFDVVIKVPGQMSSVIQNISFNRYLAMNVCFEILQAESVLNLEEDVVISSDTLNLILFSQKRYTRNKRFRGVNLGSLESSEYIRPDSYSKLRFGVHGPAFMITKRTWRKSGLTFLKKSGFNQLYDGYLEPFIKSGFMITPNLSRFLDKGVGGTHTPKSPKDPYFEGMARSFNQNQFAEQFTHFDIHHSWRYDAKKYSALHNSYFDLILVLRKIERKKRIGHLLSRLYPLLRILRDLFKR